VRIGIQLAQLGRQATPAAVRASAVAAEALGYHSVWVLDRMTVPAGPRSPHPCGIDDGLPEEQRISLDPLAVLSFAAAVTERTRLGTNVLVAPWYQPVALARSLTAIDVLSDGRLTIGLGVGWSVDEYDVIGVRQHQADDGLDAVLDVFDATWRGDLSSYREITADVRPSALRPTPVPRPRPPILLTADTPAGLDRVARRADGWTPAGLPIEMLAPMFADVRDRAAAYGREADALELVVRADVVVTDRPSDGDRPCYQGSIEQVLDDLVATAAAGAHEVVIAPSGDLCLDQTLEIQAALAEGTELRLPAS
jgi:probable F420-dependent oxidoreductase